MTIDKGGFRKLSRAALTAGAGVSALILCSEAVAQDGVVARTDEDIIVTATRREEAQIDTPVSVSVIDVDTAISAGVTDINALADLVPGLNATDGGSPGLGNLVIRGLYTGSGASTVGIYVDDVPYGPVVGGAGNSLAFDASLFDLEQLEVVRGPQGTLFGASAMGGVVRYVTRQPSLEETEGYLFADVSSTENGGVNTLARGRLSLPLASDRFAVSVSGFHSETEGYTDHPLRGEEAVDGSEFWGGLFTARAALTERLSLRLNILHQEAEYESAAAEAFDPSTGERILGERQDIAVQPTPRQLEYDLASLSADYDFSWATLSSVTSLQNLTFANQADLTLAYGPIADFFAPGGAPHTVGFESAFDTERFAQEFRLTSADSEALEWQFGLYYTDQSTDDRQVTNTTPNDIELVDVNTPLDYKELAAFGNVTFYLTPNWDVTLGARVSDIETTVNATGSGALVPPGSLPSGSVNDDTVETYLINTRYRVSEDLNLYARAASGYRPGGANLVIDLGGGVLLGQPRYEADTLWSYEAGVKGRVFGAENVTYDVGLYYIDWSDAQLLNTSIVPSGFSNAQNEVHATGIEASLTGEVMDNFFLTGALDVVTTELQGDEAVLGGAEGESLPNTPDVTASIAGDYRFALGGETEGSVGATWRYTGAYSISYDGNGVIAPTIPNYRNDAYSQFDVRAGLRWGAVSANVYVTNVTDEDAYQTVFPIAPTYAQGIILRPRTYGLNLRMDF